MENKEKESGSEGEIVLHKPSLDVSQWVFLLQHNKASDAVGVKQQLLQYIQEHSKGDSTATMTYGSSATGGKSGDSLEQLETVARQNLVTKELNPL